MDDIALSSGLSKGSIYRYFPDKNTLYTATIQSTLEEMLGWGGGGPPSDRQLFLRKAWEMTTHPRFRAAFRLSRLADPALGAMRANADALIETALVQPLARLLSQTERESSLPHDASLTRARLGVSTLLGATTGADDPPASLDSAVAFLLRACELESQTPQADGF